MLQESALLAVVGPHVSLPVPVVRFADPGIGVLAYPMLPGRPLLGRAAPAGAGRRIGRFLRELHAVETTAVPEEDARPVDWLADLEGPEELLAVLLRTIPEPAQRRVLAHADLGAEHILEHDGEITGVIDWTDAAITDPALDFARLYRDFGPGLLAEVLDAYGDQRPGMDRIAFFARCAALEDLAYGGAHAQAARRSLEWLFTL
ncbi:phosphotransferase [Dactylosporangium sucinum]|uniref:Aminoglycoside phosphotransferase domain-containing protein n=1 Tax=Dactylosporangium sucinum TaxID=1424081 RepID=A0A917U0Q8_9ACTN|nr:phosphotransferase [Dactylosporangium sucinum]GGM47290.1 hypothetical protein GCM10007977_056170 [Dactylosporangium sucinum]